MEDDMATSEKSVPLQSTAAERFFYGTYFLGQNIFFMLLLFFMLPFCTDIGIPATVVGIILLCVRVFDAANDPVFGVIVDKARLKSGKFLPWLRISLIGIPVFTILLFATPGSLSAGLKIAWAAAAYTLWSMAYTVCDIPIFGIITALTSDSHERTTLISIGRVFGILGACVVMSVLPMIRQAIGGWFPTALVLSIAAFIMMSPICFIARERVPQPKSQGEITVKALANFVFRNKYLLLFYGAMILAYGGNIGGSLGMYLARYNLGDERYMSLLSLLGYLPSVFMGALIPFITKRVDKFHALFGCVIASLILGIAAYFAGYDNVTLFMVMLFLRGIPFGGVMMFMFMFTPDFAEYGRYKTGISAYGLTFSIQTFSAKLMGAISGALAAAGLTAIGFVEGEGAVQAAGFEARIWILYYLAPCIALALSIPLFLMYKLRDKHVAVMARCNKGEINREEAEKLIGVKL
jgi:probable glucitol transport protein GutA